MATLSFVLLAGLGAAAYILAPRRVSPTESYFTQFEQRQLNQDVRNTLDLLDRSGLGPGFDPSDFSALTGFPEEGYKYSLSFTGYGLANVAAISPDRAPEVAVWLRQIIQGMLVGTVWKDWRDQGWGSQDWSKDFTHESNVMWKGHLNLLFALHILVSRSEEFAEQFHALSASLADEMARSPFAGARCEDINYYFQCNTVSVLSLRYHDVFYGTDYASLEESWLRWARDHMRFTPADLEELRERRGGERAWPDSAVGLFYAVYHPKSGTFEKRLSGYTNAWAITFLSFFDPQWARELWEKSFKPTFVRDEIPGYAWAVEEPGRGMDGLATLFTLFAAKELGDREVFDRILNLLSKAGRQSFESANPEFAGVEGVVIDIPRSAAIQGPLLFGKTNIGLRRLFATAKPMFELTEAPASAAPAELAAR